MNEQMPEYIASLCASGSELPLIRAKAILGSAMTWKGAGYTNMQTCWSLDGGKTHATDDEIRAAAGMPKAIQNQLCRARVYQRAPKNGMKERTDAQ